MVKIIHKWQQEKEYGNREKREKKVGKKKIPTIFEIGFMKTNEMTKREEMVVK